MSWSITIGTYVAATAIASALLGATLGMLGAFVLGGVGLSTSATTTIFAALVAVGLFLDMQLLKLRLPTIRRQVDRAWLDRYRGWVYGTGFGLQLGLLVVTIVNTSAIYLTLVAAFLSTSPIIGAMIVGTIGGIRGISAFPTSLIRQPIHLHRLHSIIDRLDRPLVIAVMVIQAAVVLALAGELVLA